MVNRHHIIASTSHKPHHRFQAFSFSGPVHTDKSHAVIIPQSQATICDYLASDLEGLEDKDFQTFRNKAVKLLSNTKQGSGMRHQPKQPQKDTFMKLKCNFNICATDIS